MKKLLLPFVLLLMIFTISCDTANYRKEMENNFGVWNSNLRRTSDLHSRFSEVQDKTQYKELKSFVENVNIDLVKSIDNLKGEIERQSNVDIRKLKEATVTYLESEKSIVDEYDILSKNAENMSESELQVVFNKLDTLYGVVQQKSEALEKAQDEFAAKHDIIIERHAL
jgi:elongation factor P hydroxylase